ncbi:hypothetical protein DL546_004010 [Coniochaeta pulveracea]|uniref:Uncharacterized protein n=1 Tax=Coniochaeta pulveracea TaxID=177199 RepID=A0A420XZ47_9PEZI|nr:hypothetical protein DL546_004010 [Coniochaeta pulveracea]
MSQGLAQHGAIQLNRPNGPPGGRFPPPPPPGPDVGPRPMVMNGNPTGRHHTGDMMQPHRHSALLGQHHQSLTAPPQPPRGLVPEGLRNGPAVQVCDIRKEPGRLTETGAREELSDYLIFRFELADRDKIYNDDGETVKPTWAKVVRTEAKGISKAEAARQIKDLNDHTLPLGTKKASLTETQQRQLEKVLEELEFRDVDDRFHYVLVQIDHKLQKKVTGTSSSRDRFRSPSRSMRSDRRSDYSRKRGNKYRKYGDARGRSETIVYADSRGRRRSVVKEKRGKTVRETVSLTAYYKRCPKAEVDSVALLLQRDALLARQLQPPNPHQTYAPQQLHQENNFGVQHQQYQPQPNHNMGTTPGMPVNMNGNMNMSVPPPPIGGNAMHAPQSRAKAIRGHQYATPTTATSSSATEPDLHEIEAKAYLVGRADGRADIHERFDVLNARPPSPPHRQMHQAQRLITQQSSSPLHPPLFRRATLPAAVPHTTDDLRVLLDEDRRASPLLVSRGVRPKVLNRRPSIHHIQSDYPRHGYDSLDRRQRSLERERDMLDSLDRFRLQDDMVRRREDDRYHDDVALERRLRELDLEDESRFGAEKAVRGRLRRGRDEDVTYGGGDYDDERERSPFVSVRPSIARRATVGYGYRR